MTYARGLKGGVLCAFLAVIFVNVLANSLPLFGRTTGAVSKQFDTFLTPAGLTFSIWGLIYVLLGIFVARYMIADTSVNPTLFKKMGIWFIVSCLLNIFWLIFWHGLWIVWAMLVIFLLTYAVGRIVLLLSETKHLPTSLERAAFVIYLGWLSVATLVNVSSWFASLAILDPFGPMAVIITSFILILGSGMAVFVSLYLRNCLFGWMFVWAYAGIVLKQFQRLEPAPWPIVVTALLGMIFILVMTRPRPMRRLKPITPNF